MRSLHYSERGNGQGYCNRGERVGREERIGRGEMGGEREREQCKVTNEIRVELNHGEGNTEHRR